MSFNRNQRRDHHSGGGGGGNRYSGGNNANRINRGFGREFGSNYEHNSISHSLQSSTVNPWAGNSTPESRPSLLPTPGSGNLLSQLTNTINSPEAQLLMASNLLSKLLTPANQSQSNVSSLLNMSGLGTNYANSNFTPREMDRGRNFNARRNEPYNKILAEDFPNKSSAL